MICLMAQPPAPLSKTDKFRVKAPAEIEAVVVEKHFGNFGCLSKVKPSVSASSLRRFIRREFVSHKIAFAICKHLVAGWSPTHWTNWLERKSDLETQGDSAVRHGQAVEDSDDEALKVLNNTQHNLPSLLPGVPLIGREDVLEELSAAFEKKLDETSPSIVALTGMPCVGKSAIACHYAYKNLDDYPGGVCWVHAAKGDISRQIVHFLVNVLDVTIARDLPPEMQLQYGWHHWPDDDAPVLIIVDDIDAAEKLTRLLQGVGTRFYFLLTARQQLSPSVVKRQIMVPPLETQKAVELFCEFLKGDPRADEDLPDIQQLCAWLGNLPLPIQMVADYMMIDPAGTAREIYEQLQNNRFNDDALMREVSDDQAQKGLAGAFWLSWNRLSEDAQRMGMVISQFAPEPCPWSLVKAAYTEDDAQTLLPARSLLLKFHFFAYDREGKTYSVNRLLQAFLRDRTVELNSDHVVMQTAQAVAALCRDVPDAFTKDRLATYNVLLPHIREVVTQHIQVMQGADALQSLKFWSRVCRDTGEPEQAKQWAEKAVSIAREQLGEDDLHVADALLEIALLECSLRHAEEVLKILQQVEPILDAAAPEDLESALEAAKMHYYRATAYRLQEQWPLAIQEAHTALKLRKQYLSSSDPRVTEVKVAIAAIRAGQDAPAEELEALLVPLVEQRRQDLEASGDLHLLPEILNLLAQTYQQQDKLEQAIPLFEEAVAISEKQYGQQHPQTAFGYNNLAKPQQAMRQMEIAEENYRKAIVILSTEPLAMIAPAARCRHNLGVLLSEQGQLDKALAALEAAYVTLKQSLPQGHKWVEQCYKDLEAVKAGAPLS